MMTVKEVSKLTGISVRTLHYYDEIGLFSPTDKSEAGYRLYDDSALEKLQQILFFREFDLPLKEIKAVIEDPALDRKKVLTMQKKMLKAKEERLKKLIASIDGILKGENTMDFSIFNRTEMEELFQCMFDHMPEPVREVALEEFGGVEQWKNHYIETVSSEDMQRRYAKVVQWYGGKDAFLSTAKKPIEKEVVESYNQRIKAILQKLVGKRGCPVDSFAVKEIIGEYGFVMKQMLQIKDEQAMMLAQAQAYRNERGRLATDREYGEGAARFFASAIEAFYKR